MPEADGLPDVAGLADFVQQTAPDLVQDKGNQADATPQEQAQVQEQEAPVEGKPEITDLAQFKNPKDLLKSYKEIQAFTTKVSQDNKALKEQLAAREAQMQEFAELQRLSAMRPQQTPQTEKKFDEQFVEDPEKAVEYAVEKKLATARVADVLEAEEAKNPAEFQERYSYAMRLRQAYPQLVASPQGVKKLFELGDRYRQEDMKKYAERSIKLMFGEDADVEKFKALIAKDKQPPGQQPDNKNNNLAYMPDSSSGIRPESGKSSNAHEARISAAVEKGDVDGVLKGIFNRKLSSP